MLETCLYCVCVGPFYSERRSLKLSLYVLRFFCSAQYFPLLFCSSEIDIGFPNLQKKLLSLPFPSFNSWLELRKEEMDGKKQEVSSLFRQNGHQNYMIFSLIHSQNVP